ncbi:MAG: hypothetical protein Kow0081_1410 [Candidatus Dojkabacteria bacterium]
MSSDARTEPQEKLGSTYQQEDPQNEIDIKIRNFVQEMVNEFNTPGFKIKEYQYLYTTKLKEVLEYPDIAQAVTEDIFYGLNCNDIETLKRRIESTQLIVQEYLEANKKKSLEELITHLIKSNKELFVNLPIILKESNFDDFRRMGLIAYKEREQRFNNFEVGNSVLIYRMIKEQIREATNYSNTSFPFLVFKLRAMSKNNISVVYEKSEVEHRPNTEGRLKLNQLVISINVLPPEFPHEA